MTNPLLTAQAKDIPMGEAFIRRGATVAKVIDQYGEERIIYRQKGMKDLRIKNNSTTKTLEYNRIVSELVANRIKEIRLDKEMTMKELGELCGYGANAKTRIYEMEKNTRKDGLRLGTLYVLCEALGVEIDELMPMAQEVGFISTKEHDEKNK